MKVRSPAQLLDLFPGLPRGLFKPSDVERALDHLETPPEERVELRRTLAELKRELTQPTPHAST
jgi:hypothetical protein